MKDQMDREVLGVGQSGTGMGQRSRRGSFPGPVGEEPELEMEMLGFSLQLLGLRQKRFGPV